MLAHIDPSLIAAALGPVSHLTWFIHGEHDYYARSYVAAFFAFEVLGFYLLLKAGDSTILSAAFLLTKITASYLSTLTASILAYRILWHPLRRFPGPFSWKVCKFTQVLANQDSQGWKHIHDIHEKHGQFVRLGSNEISITHPDAPHVIFGPGTKCTKAAWYDMSLPLQSMQTTRDKKLHDKRRRVWDQAFSAKALRNYDSRVVKYAEELFRQIAAHGGGPFNASRWFNFYSFDVMGDLTFGKPFDMLTKGETHFAIELLQGGMEPMSFATSVPWFFWVLSKIPGLAKGHHRFIKWSEEQALERKNMKVEEPDVMKWLIDAPPMSEDPNVDRQWLAGDARLIIVAGSDTTAAGLSFATCELLRNPEYITKLRREVEPLISEGIDQVQLQNAELLNGVINETLRLHPPVPSEMLRVTPPDGITIGGTYIPGNTVVNVPPFSIQRSPDAFVDPEKFIPERWGSKPDLIKHKGAFVPFSTGAYSCIGKSLAMMELRTVLSMLVTRFDISFAPGEDGRALIEDTKEHFTLSLADLKICAVPRKIK